MVPDTVDGRILYHLVFIKPYENMGYSPCQLVDFFHQRYFKQQIPQYLTRTCPTLQKSDVGYPVEGSWRGFMFHKRDSSMADGTQ